LVAGERHTYWGERGPGEFQIQTRGQTLWYSRFICTLCTVLYKLIR
jgi:hypothetical protein